MAVASGPCASERISPAAHWPWLAVKYSHNYPCPSQCRAQKLIPPAQALHQRLFIKEASRTRIKIRRVTLPAEKHATLRQPWNSCFLLVPVSTCAPWPVTCRAGREHALQATLIARGKSSLRPQKHTRSCLIACDKSQRLTLWIHSARPLDPGPALDG